MSGAGLHARVVVHRPGFRLDVDIKAVAGEVVAVLGPNGAGKSTLLRTLAGLTPVTGGRITLDDRVLDDAESGSFTPVTERRVGVVFQDYRLFGHLNVRDNVAFGPRSRGTTRRTAGTAADTWLQRLGIDQLADRRPAALSGGQAQRVALARALAAEPDLLLLDEPLAALDAQTRIDVRTVLRDHLHSFTGPCLLVTHDPLDALLLADRLIVLEEGVVRQDATPAAVAARPATDYVARLLGVNLYRGRAEAGVLQLVDGAQLVITDNELHGEVVAMVRPSSITVHPDHPGPSSARNVWPATVQQISLLGDRVRLTLAGQPDAIADLTPQAMSDLGILEGREVWLSAKATDVQAYRPDL
ncbi:MAG: sulfate/molybdate ABC transporter ATP-binding protein [Jatrophihabitans sp.]